MRGDGAPTAGDAGQSAVRVSDEEFRRLRDLFYRRTGITFSDAKRYYVDRRLAARMSATGSVSFRDYFTLLQSDVGELQQLINAFTVNETYFYREEHQLRCLTSALLDQIAARKRPDRPIRIWSVPCSTGEEPYSIAIFLLENWARVDEWNIEIEGSDIDTRALRAAADGVYGARSLMRLTPALIDKYFEQVADSRYRITGALRESVGFSRVNVIDPLETASRRNLDVIFCRNMLIYFDETSRRQVAENLYDCLAPGGFICLGHTESMSRISSLFRVCRFADAIVYQKPMD